MRGVYYPYLRGKQFDLLALKSLLESDLLSRSIQPIIEPVKQSKAFWTVVDLLKQKNHPCFIIDNPSAGDFLTDEGLQELIAIPLQKARIVDQPIETYEISPDMWIIHQAEAALESDWLNNQIPILLSKEFRLLNRVAGPKIIMEDPFTRLPKHSFYTEYATEMFSSRKKTYQQLGFYGYSDFSIDSKIYYESSYPSKRIAIHWIFPDATGELHIAHLVSDEDLANQKAKFFQVMDQLSLHEQSFPTQTLGLQLLQESVVQDKFPGMGVIRKASVMNHLELVSRLWDK
ncbi:hypothetical protein IGI41_001434 [Enterococcus sp. DIV0876]